MAAAKRTADPTNAQVATPDPPDLRDLLARRSLAAYRQRALVARRLSVSEAEITALIVLSTGPMKPGALATELNLSSGGMTALLHRLTRAGYIDRQPDPHDGRSVRIHLHPDALAALTSLLEPLHRELDALADALSPLAREAVVEYLDAANSITDRFLDHLLRDDDAPSATTPSRLAWA